IDYYITPEEYEIAEKNGIDGWNLERRIRYLGWSKQKAIYTPKRKRDTRYSSLAKKAIKNGITRKAFYMRIKRGMCPIKASEKPMLSNKEILMKMDAINRRDISRNALDAKHNIKKTSLTALFVTFRLMTLSILIIIPRANMK